MRIIKKAECFSTQLSREFLAKKFYIIESKGFYSLVVFNHNNANYPVSRIDGITFEQVNGVFNEFVKYFGMLCNKQYVIEKAF